MTPVVIIIKKARKPVVIYNDKLIKSKDNSIFILHLFQITLR
jgi:hypothetical protein